MDQETFETLTLAPAMLGDDRLLLVDNVIVQIHKYNGNPIGLQFPPHVELTVTSTEPGVRGDTASGSVTKAATLETGLEIRVPLFIKEGEKVKVHTETREFAGRAGSSGQPFRVVRVVRGSEGVVDSDDGGGAALEARRRQRKEHAGREEQVAFRIELHANGPEREVQVARPGIRARRRSLSEPARRSA